MPFDAGKNDAFVDADPPPPDTKGTPFCVNDPVKFILEAFNKPVIPTCPFDAIYMAVV
jgi:hypothetical protein